MDKSNDTLILFWNRIGIIIIKYERPDVKGMKGEKMKEKVDKLQNGLIEKIGLGEKVAYGFGDLASNLILALTSTMITYFYTNVIGIAAGAVGTIMLVSRIFDGISDVGMGIIVDKTNTKYGKARPWLLWLAVPFALSAVALIAIPDSLSSTSKIVYAFITYNLVTTILYTGINIPYGTLNSLMTRDQYQRSVINLFRMTMGQTGSLVITAVTLPIINYLGGTHKAWIQITCVYAIMTIALFLICFKATKERVRTNGQSLEEEDKIPVGVSIKALCKNKYWLILVVVWTIVSMVLTVSGTCSTYFAQYILGNSNYMGLMNAATTAPVIISIPLMAPMIKKWGKRNIALAGSVVAIVSGIIMILRPTNLVVLLIACVIRGIGNATIIGTIFAMVADTIEYGQWKTGIRVQGLLYSSSTLGAKIGAGVGAAATGYILELSGFDGMAMQQSNSTIQAIQILFILIPIAGAVIQAICLFFYKLDKEYDGIITDLKKRENNVQ